MNALLKKTLPITLLLLSGCVHHPGFHPGIPFSHGSFDISLGNYYHKGHRHGYKSKGYFHKWRPFYSDRHNHDYHLDYKYRGKKHYGRGYRDKYSYGHSRDRYHYRDYDNKHRKKHYKRKRRRDW